MAINEKCVIRLENAAIYHNENPFTALTERNVSKQGEKVLSEVNLRVSAGEFVYFIGRVGSGKSSLIRTLYAELPLLEGEGEVAGYDLRQLRNRDIPYLRRNIGIVFQDLQLLSDRNAYQNLAFVLRATGWRDEQKISERIAEVLDLTGIADKQYKMPFELSGGERQRLVIARALLNSPTLILADEPTGNLDPVTAESIVRLFHEIAAAGTAVVMATHNTSLIESYPSRTLLFSQGAATEVDITELLSVKSSI